MSNPVLTRQRQPRRSASTGWYLGVPLAVVAVGAGAYFIVAQLHRQPSLLTTEPTPQPAMAPALPAPSAEPQATAPAPAEPASVPRRERLARQDREDRLIGHHIAVRRARAATEEGADVAAVAPSVPTVTPPAPPPTITPPPAVIAPPNS